MATYSVRCPHCGTISSQSHNTQYKCRGCGARIVLGNYGEIKMSVPKK